MPHYTLNFLDPHGRVVGRFEFRCPDDAEAELACEDLADHEAKVLWCGSRQIRAWPPSVPGRRPPAATPA